MRKKLKLWVFSAVIIVITVVAVLFINNYSGKNPLFNLQSSSGRWVQDENGWKAVGKIPKCPEPIQLGSVADLSQATSVLYPGQMRSVGYENTAGFRFEKIPNDEITVMAPMDGEVVMAARFLVDGEIQYVFDILSPCGIMNRFDHLLTLSPKLQEIANSLPQPKNNDNRSTLVSPPVKISQGEVLATGVGLRKNNNTFLSWTVFDFRGKNKASQDPAWAENHPIMDHYAICPFPFLPNSDQDKIKSLPAADFMSSSKSDFCD